MCIFCRVFTEFGISDLEQRCEVEIAKRAKACDDLDECRNQLTHCKQSLIESQFEVSKLANELNAERAKTHFGVRKNESLIQAEKIEVQRVQNEAREIKILNEKMLAEK